jgi:hypothetical protein
MDLIKYLQENWDKSKFIKVSLNNSIRNQIENSTSFLNLHYDSIPLRVRAYVLVNDITENTIPKCKCGCGKVCGIDKHILKWIQKLFKFRLLQKDKQLINQFLKVR